MKIPLVLSIVVPLLSSIIASNAYAQTQPNAPFNIPAIEDDVKIITVNGNDNNGNTVSIEIIISRGTMMLSRNAMMMGSYHDVWHAYDDADDGRYEHEPRYGNGYAEL
jgi:hypothetical protein